VRPDVVVRRDAVDLGVPVAAEAREDRHEEVDDAVLVGVVVVVVDLRVGDLGGVEDGLAGRPAGRVDVLQRADAGHRADERRALGVVAVVVRRAGQLVPAVLDPLGLDLLVAVAGQRGVGDAAARVGIGRVLRELEAGLVVPARRGDARRGHGPVREQLPVGHLLVEVERRAGVLRVVDLAGELARAGGGLMAAVGVVDRHDGERPVAVARRLVAALRRDHLRPVAAGLDRLAAVMGERREVGEVLPDDLRVLLERVGLRPKTCSLTPGPSALAAGIVPASQTGLATVVPSGAWIVTRAPATGCGWKFFTRIVNG